MVCADGNHRSGADADLVGVDDVAALGTNAGSTVAIVIVDAGTAEAAAQIGAAVFVGPNVEAAGVACFFAEIVAVGRAVNLFASGWLLG